ncbi:ABC transporter permease [Youngiibacter multivorans]|uniref:Simple sugar transport system permease protein n=1 Tax=Youngiibacter multivorans TaxID=937251 RepID=A0ABS4G6F8_9CLOT|nr:ABC transporter permease [Youngiibacter multivorans]MBP1920114.1 simple sugar transport system permease protein [Youngiibacter multivorans]
MNLIGNILYDTVYHSTPIILAVLGGLFAYKANVLNIGLEGMIVMGAFSSSLSILLFGNFYLGILIAITCTLLVGLIFSLFSITLKSNFIITGFGLNILVAAIGTFTLKFMKLSNINLSQIINVNDMKIAIPVVNEIPILSNILSNHTIITYVAFLLIAVVYIVLYKTRFGIHLRVVGENEEAAKSVGLKSDMLKYSAILIGAVLCALAGINLSAERMALYTDNMVAGRGFIAIAAIYCGKAHPVKSSIYAILFGLARSLAINLGLYAGPISGLFDMIPYIMIVLVLFFVSSMESKKTRLRGFRNA